MVNRKKTSAQAATIRETIKTSGQKGAQASGAKGAQAAHPSRAVIRSNVLAVEGGCDDCRARTAFQAWRVVEMPPSFNVGVDFGSSGIPPKGQRAVIELITATITVPSGEWARLRLFTSLGTNASNLDFVLTPQGEVSGRRMLVATHSVRVYSDGLIEFNVNRDNATTTGEAFICISGYLVDA